MRDQQNYKIVTTCALVLILGLQVDKVQAWQSLSFRAFSTIRSQFSQPLPYSRLSSTSSSIRHHRLQSLVLFESDSGGNVETKQDDETISEAEKLRRSAEQMRLQAEEMEVKLIQDKLDSVIKKLDKLNKKIKNAKPEDQEKNMALVQEKIDLTQQVQLLEYRLDPKREKPSLVPQEEEVPEAPEATATSTEPAEEEEAEEETAGTTLTDNVMDNVLSSMVSNMADTVEIPDDEKLTVQVNLGDSSINIVKDENNQTVADSYGITEQDLVDNFEKYSDKVGKVIFTAGNSSSDELLAFTGEASDARDCLWQSNEDEYVGKLAEEELQLIDDIEKKWQDLLEVFLASRDNKRKGPLDAFRNSNTAEDEAKKAEKEKDMQTALAFANNTFAEARAGNVSKEELELADILNSGANFCLQNIGFLVEIGMNLVEGFKVEEEDPFYMERFNLYQEAYGMNLLSLRRNRLEEGVETAFCNEVLDLNPKLFSRTAKPRQIGSAFLIEGKVIEQDGNKIISGLQESLAKSSLKDKVNIFYLRDPSPQIEMDEVQQADFIQTNGGEDDFGRALELVNGFEPPALLITGTNLTSDFPIDTRVGISTFAFFNLVTTVGAMYYPNADPNYFQEFFAGIQSPIVAYLLGTFAMQHVIQVLMALKGGFKISPLPFLVPGLWGIPTLGSAVKVNSPPKNKNDIFDFGFLAPFVGFLVSYGFIVLGLENTMQMTNAAQIAQLPHFELDALKESFLTSATIESVMGTNVLLSLAGVSNSVPLDPMVIAGHIGMMINAIQLIPTLLDTNGGRAGIASLGRFSVGYGGLVGLSTAFLLVQAYRGGSGTLNFVALLMSFRILFRPEMPCQNDVDTASTARQVALGISLILAVLALSPA